MFNIATMKTALFGAIGLRNSDDPAFEDILSTITASSTGMYWNDYHPLITFENLYAVCPNYDGYNISAWAEATTYAEAAMVKDDGTVYISTAKDNKSHDPDGDDDTWWKLPINNWLTQKINAAISKVLNRMFTDKKLQEATKSLLENIQLFDGSGCLADVITGNSRFVGLEIIPKRINNIQLIINYIGLQFTETQTDLTIYLFHSSRPAAVATIDITTTTAKRFAWTTAVEDGVNAFTLNYVDLANDIDSGGSYYLGYFEDDISGQAIKKRYQFAGPPCAGCNGVDLGLYNLWNRFFDVRPFAVASGDLDGTNLWDISKMGYLMTTNFGINLSVSAKTDVTEMLSANTTVFTDALGYQFAIDMLNEFIYNPNSRLNRDNDNSQRSAVLYELNNPNDESTLYKRLEKAINALSFDFSKVSQVLPSRGRKMKMGSM